MKFGFSLIASLLIPVSAAAVDTLFTRKTPNDAKAKLLSKARSLANNNNNAVTLTEYVVKFEKCQFVKSFDDELAANDQSSSVLATRRFVIFRLCPEGSCSSCNYGYGEYVIDLDSYLQYAVDFVQQKQQAMCNSCQNYCYNDNNNYGNNNGNGYVDCSTCVGDCSAIANMENLGYVDATSYIECTQVYEANDDSNALYAGAMCSSSGEKIKIGIFSDEECTIHTNNDISDYLGYDENGQKLQMSYGLLSEVYENDECITCIEDNGNANNYYPESNELCEGLYGEAAKCESAHNFNNGYTNYGNYQNQAAQEEVVCKFISSLSSGTYDETGEIRIGSGSSSKRSSGGNSTSGAQKFFLTVFILGTVGLAAYAAMLHQKITNKGGKGTEGLAAQGGTIA